jgi:hypothetical protein
VAGAVDGILVAEAVFRDPFVPGTGAEQRHDVLPRSRPAV